RTYKEVRGISIALRKAGACRRYRHPVVLAFICKTGALCNCRLKAELRPVNVIDLCYYGQADYLFPLIHL
ncbi:MAG: hypothetical protein ACOCQP_03985, partial [Lentisphaeria bacterium]